MKISRKQLRRLIFESSASESPSRTIFKNFASKPTEADWKQAAVLLETYYDIKVTDLFVQSHLHIPAHAIIYADDVSILEQLCEDAMDLPGPLRSLESSGFGPEKYDMAKGERGYYLHDTNSPLGNGKISEVPGSGVENRNFHGSHCKESWKYEMRLGFSYIE